MPLPPEVLTIIMQTINLQTVNDCLLRTFEAMSRDVLNIIAEYYYCPPVVTAFRNNRLEHRFLGNVYDTEGENDEESDIPMSLPIHVFANMFQRRMEFTAIGRTLRVEDRNSHNSNVFHFDSSICGVFTSGNFTLVVTDLSNGSGPFRSRVHFLNTGDVSDMEIREVRTFPNDEIIIFAHDGHIISSRFNQLHIYDMGFNHVCTFQFTEKLGRIALIDGNIIVQGSRVDRNIVHYSYYELDLEDYTLEEVHPEDVNEGEVQVPQSPPSSDDEDDEEAPQAVAQIDNEPANAEVIEQRDPNDISHYFVSDEEYYGGMSEEEYYRMSEASDLGKRKSRE